MQVMKGIDGYQGAKEGGGMMEGWHGRSAVMEKRSKERMIGRLNY